MPRWINMDGMLHIVGDTEVCSCERRDGNLFSTCKRCNGVQHWQPIYGGIMEACPTCDAKDFHDGPMPPHDSVGIVE